MERFLPARAAPEDPLHPVIPPDLHDCALMPRRNNDRVICRIVIHGIHVRPVASGAGSHDVAEVALLIELLEVLRGYGLPREIRVDIEAHRALI